MIRRCAVIALYEWCVKALEDVVVVGHCLDSFPATCLVKVRLKIDLINFCLMKWHIFNFKRKNSYGIVEGWEFFDRTTVEFLITE